MKQTTSFSIGIGIIAVLIIAGAAYALFNQQQEPDERFTVAATIFPLADIVQNIAGENTRVVTIIPAGASPHSYSISAEQLTDLQHAQAIFAIGHNLDTNTVDQIVRTLPSSPEVVTVDQGIALHEFGAHEDEHEEEDNHAHEGIDPHYWLTVPNAQQMARTIAATLSEMNAEQADVYSQNLEAYLAELDAVEAELQAQAARATQKDFIATHDAWSYFSEHYGFELVGTYEPIEGQEPSPSDLQELQEIIEEHTITTFYTEPQKRSTAATRFFERELDLTIGTLDPEGSLEADSYIELMKFNMNSLTNS